jgi:hypothetical protein
MSSYPIRPQSRVEGEEDCEKIRILLSLLRNMSWLADFTSPDGPRRERAPVNDGNPKVDDGTGRMVSTKSANQPFLA